MAPLPIERVAGQHAPWLGTQVAAETLVQKGTALPLTPFGWSLRRSGTVVDTIDAQGVRLTCSTGRALELTLPWP